MKYKIYRIVKDIGPITVPQYLGMHVYVVVMLKGTNKWVLPFSSYIDRPQTRTIMYVIR